MVPDRRMAVAVQPSLPMRMPPRQPRLLPVDIVLLGYLAVVSAVAVHRAGARPACWWVVAANGLTAVLIALLCAAGTRARRAASLREIYPLLLLVGLYGQLDVLNSGGVQVHDGLVQRWELTLFGTQVSREWWQAAPSRFWSTVLHGAYFSYYFIVVDPGGLLPLRGDVPAARRFVLSVMTTFVVCYLVFIFFPVAGPYYDVPATRTAGSSTTRGATGVRHARRRQLLRSGLPDLARRGHRGRRACRRQRLPSPGARAAVADDPAHESGWSTARCTTGSTRWPGWWSGSWSRWRSGA